MTNKTEMSKDLTEWVEENYDFPTPSSLPDEIKQDMELMYLKDLIGRIERLSDEERKCVLGYFN